MRESYEPFQIPEDAESAELLDVRNNIQGAFIMNEIEGLGESLNDLEDREMRIQKWLRAYSYSGVFRQVFNEYMTHNPNLISEWHDLNKREKILNDIKSRLPKIADEPDSQELAA